MCTFLSPGYREILSDEQVAAARSHLIKLLNPQQRVEQIQVDATQEDRAGTTDEPPPKRFKHLTELLKEKKKAKECSSATSASLSDEETEVEKYTKCDYTGSIDDDEDPFIFW